MDDRCRRLRYDPTVINNPYWAQLHPKAGTGSKSRHKKSIPSSSGKNNNGTLKADFFEVSNYLKPYRDKYGSVSAHSTSAIYGALRAPHCHAMYNTSDMWYASVRSLNSRPREGFYPTEGYDWRDSVYENGSREGHKQRELLQRAPCACMVPRKPPTNARPPPRCKYCATVPPPSRLLKPAPLAKRMPLITEKSKLNSVSEEKDEKSETMDRMAGYKKHITNSKSKISRYVKETNTKEMTSRKSILECDVTAYDLIKELPNSPSLSDVEESDHGDKVRKENLTGNSTSRLKKHQAKLKNGRSKIESLLQRSQKSSSVIPKMRNENNVYNDSSSVLLGGQRIFTACQGTKSPDRFSQSESESVSQNSCSIPWQNLEESVSIPEPDYDYSDDSDSVNSGSFQFKDLKLTYSPPLIRKSSYESQASLGTSREISKSLSSLVSQETIIPNISIKHSSFSPPLCEGESAAHKECFRNTSEPTLAKEPVESDANFMPDLTTEPVTLEDCAGTVKSRFDKEKKYGSFSSSDCSSNTGTLSSDYPTWTSSSSGELKSILKKKKRRESAKDREDAAAIFNDSDSKGSYKKKQVQFRSNAADATVGDNCQIKDSGSQGNTNTAIHHEATGDDSVILDGDLTETSENIYETLNKSIDKCSSVERRSSNFSNTGNKNEGAKVSKLQSCEKSEGVKSSDKTIQSMLADDSSWDVPIINSFTERTSERQIHPGGRRNSSPVPKLPERSSSLEDVRDSRQRRTKEDDDDKKDDGRKKRRAALPKRRFSDLHLHILLCPARSLCGDGSSSDDVPLTSPSHRAHRSLPDSPSELQDNAFCFDFSNTVPKHKDAPSSRSTFYVSVEDASQNESHHSGLRTKFYPDKVTEPTRSSSFHSTSDDDVLDLDGTTSPAMDDTDDDNLENEYENLDPIYEELSEIPNSTKRLPTTDPHQKSFFEGASKTDILSYLEDAKERGLSEGLTSEDESKIIPEEEEEGDGDKKVIITDDNNKDRIAINNNLNHQEGVLSEGDEARSSLENIVSEITNETNKESRSPSAEVERNDSGVGTETSKPSRVNKILLGDNEEQLCADCDHHVDPIEDELSGLLFNPLVCRKCDLKRCERKEIIIEFVDTEVKYGRDLRIIKEEFYRPMEIAGLLAKEQLLSVFINLEELISFNIKFTEKLKDALDIAMEQGDEDYTTVNIGKIFLETSSMLHAFETYCVKQASASVLLSNLEKEKELLRIFLRVSQMENTLLRRMNLPAFLMVPVQRVTRYPLLLSRLHKVTPIHHKDRNPLKEAQQKVELHLEHINQQTKGVSGTKIWRRISNISASHRRMGHLQDIGSIKLRKMALEILKWKQDEVRFAMAGKLLFSQVTDFPWNKRGRTVKFTALHALLVALGKPNANYRPETVSENPIFFPRNTGIRDASLVLMKEKNGRFILVREPLSLGCCVISCDSKTDDVLEIQEYTTKEAYLIKGENRNDTKEWLRQLHYHAKDLGSWRRRRNALANIMINGMIRP